MYLYKGLSCPICGREANDAPCDICRDHIENAIDRLIDHFEELGSNSPKWLIANTIIEYGAEYIDKGVI